MSSIKRPTVYICNKSYHDFSPALEWGDIVFLTEGRLNIYDVGMMWRACDTHLADSQPGDFILQTSLSVLFAIACSFMAAKHGLVNMLLFSKGRYIVKTISFRDYQLKEQGTWKEGNATQ